MVSRKKILDSTASTARDREGDSSSSQPATLSKTMGQLFWQGFRRHRLALVSVLILLGLITVCFTVPIFVSEDQANRLILTRMRQPPSLDHPFGTDDVGRDMLLRVIFGGRISLQIGILAALVSMSVGVAVGALSGFYSGWIDNVLMRFTEALLSIPRLFILIVLAKVIGQSLLVITLVIGLLSWMDVSRIVRANVLSLKEQDFVTASTSVGSPRWRILLHHILPNTVSPIVVSATLTVGQAIILEASLSFLGLGVQPPTATWGNMLFRAQSYLVDSPWIAFFPGFMILVTVLCINFIGDGLRDALDPRS
jgi:peptide/nickel transport system permease protein